MTPNLASLIPARLPRIGDKLGLEIARGMETRERLRHPEESPGPANLLIASISRRDDRIAKRLGSEHPR